MGAENKNIFQFKGFDSKLNDDDEDQTLKLLIPLNSSLGKSLVRFLSFFDVPPTFKDAFFLKWKLYAHS